MKVTFFHLGILFFNVIVKISLYVGSDYSQSAYDDHFLVQ